MVDSADDTRVPVRPDLPPIAIVGAGRAGTALAVGLRAAGHPVVAVHSRSPRSARVLAEVVGATVSPTAVDAARRAEITLVTVPDRAVTSVAATVAATGMALPGRVLVHCAAARGRDALAAARITTAAVAALHPLQALAGAGSAGRLRGSGFALDADPAARPRLEALVDRLGGQVLDIDPDHRAAYHAAAVLAGNAPLALLARAADLLADAGVERGAAVSALTALLGGALANAASLGPDAALTGPVVRDDAATVAAHLAALRGHPEVQQLYRALALETLRLVGPAGRPAVAAVLGATGDRPGLRRVSAA